MRKRLSTIPLVAMGLVALSGCVDEKIVFQDRELFEEPLAAAVDFLGYTDHETKLTVCGNCHIGPQGEWEDTDHADAWDGLQDSGHAQAFCEGCHTVNALGNAATGDAGYTATMEARYEDVQCESCHGSGLAHVTNPTDATIPLAPMTVGADATQGCGECHQGTHHPFMEQWATSAHGNVTGFAAGRDYCKNCHSGNGALDSWGINTTYQEEGQTFDITCAVCHDPHADDEEGQLRFPVGGQGVAIQDNLCSQCHDRRSEPDASSSHGLHPHSPETGLLEGDVGWFPPGLEINRGQIVASHGDQGNARLCATCHVVSEEITDAATGEFAFQAVGHGFNAIPCLDENGIPTSGDCTLDTDSRSFTGCLGSGCHSSPQNAFSALSSATAALEFWVEELHHLLEQVDANLDGNGGEIDATDGIFTVAEGAFFNMELAEFGGTGRPSASLAYASAAAHNPFLTEQLLIASIQAVRDEYNVTLKSPLVTLEPRIKADGQH